MSTLSASKSILLVVDLQKRLVPAMHNAASLVANTKRLITAARALNVPVIFTEQNSKALGSTVEELASPGDDVVHKMSFDAFAAEELIKRIPVDRELVVCGVEAHICVLQTVLGPRGRSHATAVVRDAIGSRTLENHEAAVARMAQRQVEIVTTEMVVFEWLGTADHPRFREMAALIK